MAKNLSQNSIKRRKIFYLSGFDPRGFRHYYNLYKEHTQKFCDREHKNITIGSRKKLSDYETQFTITNHDTETLTDYSYLHWDDLVKKSWIKSNFDLFFKGLKIYLHLFLNFSFLKAWRLNYAPVITLIYPFFTLVAFPAILTYLSTFIYSGIVPVLVYATLWITLWIKLLHNVNSLWLLRLFIFNIQCFVFDSYDYSSRSKIFYDIITKSFQSDYDEIILVTHSNGSIAAIPILDMIEEIPENFKILSLSHCIPLISLNRLAHHFHNQMKNVASKTLKWFDIGFPPDGAGYTKTDPFPKIDNRHLKFIGASAKLFEYYDKAKYETLRKDKFNLHFDYLRTPDKPSPLEFIAITAGDTPLEKRFYD